MLVKTLKAFPYYPDGFTRQDIPAGEIVDLKPEVIPSLIDNGCIEDPEAPAKKPGRTKATPADAPKADLKPAPADPKPDQVDTITGSADTPQDPETPAV